MTQPKQRLLSLDFFRGLTVAAMILVNNPGSWGHIYAPLEHAEWNGCTPTDLVFPFFLWIVGVSIAFAMSSSKADPSTHKKTIIKAVKRGLTLYFLGFFLAIFGKLLNDPANALQTVRLLGVLQRIGIVFIISSIIFLKASQKTIFKTLIVILAVYWALMTFVPVPGVGYANMEKETNLAAWIDRGILTEAHIWASSKTWDPEGVLSTLPAVGTCLFGILVGIWMRRKDVDNPTKVAWLFTAGIAAVVLGLLWDFQFPINKALWTSSYVLYAGGLASVALAFCYWVIDVQGYKKFTTPFVVYGVNAITVFFLAGLMPRVLNLIQVTKPDGTKTGILVRFYETCYIPFFSPINASLVWAITYVLGFYILLYFMYKKNIIIKV
ncbi:acyltransferase family protein [Pedobacter jamesrossensis]|uniref:Acyltransferase family protein n=1 Tax=Pedobacter jamesrossensis TaxID=1908238 RepID=A0ABV8NIM2_9SPHI